MIYNLQCNICNNIKSYNIPFGEKVPRNIKCDHDNCDGIMNQNFRTKKICEDIPCTFDSYGEYAPKNYNSDNHMEEYMDRLDQ